MDSRVFRGTYLQSDHRLVVAKVRVKEVHNSGDWVTSEVCRISELKKKAWVRWMDDPGKVELKVEYLRLKALSKKKVTEAKEKWWREQAQELGERYEECLRAGMGGSLLRNLKVLRSSQALHILCCAGKGWSYQAVYSGGEIGEVEGAS